MYIRDYKKAETLYDNDAFIVDGSQETQYILASDLFKYLIGTRNFVTESELLKKGYQTADQVNTAIVAKGYKTEAEIKTIIEGYNYKTESQVKTIIEGYGYQNSEDVNRIIDSKNFLKDVDLDGYATVNDLNAATASLQVWVTNKQYTTINDLNTISSNLQNWVINRGYQTSSQVNTIIDGKGYKTEAEIKTIIEGYGYITESEALDASKSILNMYETRPSSVNVDFRIDDLRNRVTYTEVGPQVTGHLPDGELAGLIMVGADSTVIQKGAQLALVFDRPKLYFRHISDSKPFSKWYEIITEYSISKYQILPNIFDTRVASVKIDFSIAPYHNALTYSIATTEAASDLPTGVTDGNILNFGWDNAKWGRQVLFANNNTIWFRRVDGEGVYGDWIQAIGSGSGGGAGTIDTSKYMPRAFESENELNFASYNATDGQVYINYRDGITKAAMSKLIERYNFCKGNGTGENNLSDIRAKNGVFTTRVLPLQGILIADMAATAGTAGYLKLATIKINGTYANIPCTFVLGRRGSSHIWIVCVYYQSYNGYAPSLDSFYQIGDYSVKTYIINEGNGVWSLYLQKNEAYGEVFVWNAYVPPTKYAVTYPNTQVASLPSGSIAASLGGTVYRSYRVYDSSGNGNDVSFSYGSDGLAYSDYTWLAGWNGYQLRAVHKSQYMAEVNANGYWGMTAAGGSGTADWVRTTQAGIIPYQGGAPGSGHGQLGTSSWYFAKTYSDEIYAIRLYLGGTNFLNRVMEAFDDGDSANYGNELCISGGGNVFIGAGESPYNLRTDLQTSGNRLGIEAYGKAAENMYVSSDGAIALLTNCNTVANRNGILMDADGNFYPAKTQLQNLGMSTKHWNEGYIKRLHISGSIVPMAGPGVAITFTGTTTDFTSSQDQTTKVNGISIYTPPSAASAILPQIIPQTTNCGSVGISGKKFNQFYATNTTISSSDRREKKEISYIGQDSEYNTNMTKEIFMQFMRGLKSVIFKRIDGESGRPHHGFIAQDIEELMKRLGIKDHAAFIKSPKTKDVEVEKKIINEDGATEVIKEMAQEIIPGEYIYGLRYEEFIADAIKYTQCLDEENQEFKAKIEDLEFRLVELEKKVMGLAV